MTNTYLYQYSYMEIKVIYEVKMNYLRKEHIYYLWLTTYTDGILSLSIYL